jgi:membrane carboxypeptidase/penicillin-binding protein PbpC
MSDRPLQSESPVRAGTQIRITMHAFSKAQFEDEASNIVAAMQKSLENAVLDVGAGLKAYLAYVGSQILADPAEADAWHGVATWNATIG